MYESLPNGRPSRRHGVLFALPVVFTWLALTGCGKGEAVKAGRDEAPPAAVRTAIDGLKAALGGRLKTELQEGGPVAAIEVCQREAHRIAAAASRGDVQVGRTSDRLRNPENAPPDWARGVVATYAGQRLDGVQKRHLIDLGGPRRGYLEAIGVDAVCVTCHGPAEQIAPPLRTRLAALYPADQATGFVPGDLRGWFWAEFEAQ